jgi:hypothetical protein
MLLQDHSLALQPQLKVKVTLRLTVSQSVSLGVEPHFLLFNSYGLVFVERLLWREDGFVFVYAAGPCQRSLSRVRVPWDSRPYFTVSDLRLPFRRLLPLGRATVEVFDPASTGVSPSQSQSVPTTTQSQSYFATHSQSVCLSWCRAPPGAHDQIFIFHWKLQSCPYGAPSVTGGRVCHLLVIVDSKSLSVYTNMYKFTIIL